MIRLHTLGSVRLEAADRHAQLLLRRPRSIQLLTYLAVGSREVSVSRDELIGVFWPESTDKDARHALSQALLTIRRAIGAETLVATRTGVRVDPGGLWCDAAAFDELAAAGSWSTAVELYVGDFLPGVISSSPDVDQWIDRERARLKFTAADAAWRAAEEYALAGERVFAARLAARAAAIADHDERVVERAVRLLVELGCNDAAAAVHDAYVTHATEILEVPPTATVTGLLRRLEPKPQQMQGEAHPSGLRHSVTHEPSWRQGREHVLPAVLTLVIALAAVFSLFTLLGFHARGPGRSAAAATHVVSMGGVCIDSSDECDLDLRAFTADVTKRLSDAGLDLRHPGAEAVERQHARFHVQVHRRHAPDSAGITARVSEYGSWRLLAVITEGWQTGEAGERDEVVRDVAVQIRRALGASLRQRPDPAEPVRLAQLRRDRWRADSLISNGNLAAARVLLTELEAELDSVAAHGKLAGQWALERAFVARDLGWIEIAECGVQCPEVRQALGRALSALAPASSTTSRSPDVSLARANLHYWLWRTAPADSAALLSIHLRASRALLEHVVSRDERRHDAWALLATIYEADGAFAAAYRAARRAQAQDLFAEQYHAVSVRLFRAALEVGDTATARSACRAFRTSEWIRAECELTLALVVRHTAPAEIERLRRFVRGGATSSHPTFDASIRVLYAAVLAAAGHAHEARTIDQSVAKLGVADPDLPVYRTLLLLELGENEEAARVFADYVEARPATRSFLRQSVLFARLAPPVSK